MQKNLFLKDGVRRVVWIYETPRETEKLLGNQKFRYFTIFFTRDADNVKN